jgi:hypothetical protein
MRLWSAHRQLLVISSIVLMTDLIWEFRRLYLLQNGDATICFVRGEGSNEP